MSGVFQEKYTGQRMNSQPKMACKWPLIRSTREVKRGAICLRNVFTSNYLKVLLHNNRNSIVFNHTIDGLVLVIGEPCIPADRQLVFILIVHGTLYNL